MSARASIVVSVLARPRAHFSESQGIRGQRVLLSLLLLFAFLVCASMHKVDQARALGLSTQASIQSHDFEPTAMLGPTSAVPACAQDHAPPPLRELDAVETEDTEQDARVDLLAFKVSVRLSQARPDIGQAPPVVAEACTDKFWVSSALPRGPPDTLG